MKELILLPMPRRVEWRSGEYVLESGRTIALVGTGAQELLGAGQRLREALARAGVRWELAGTEGEDTGAVLGVTGERVGGEGEDGGGRLRVRRDRGGREGEHSGARLGLRDERGGESAGNEGEGSTARTEGWAGNAEGYALEISERGVTVEAGTARGIFYGVCTLAQIVEQSGRRLPRVRVVDWPDFPNRGVMWDVSRTKVPKMETLYALVEMLSSWKVNQLQLYTEHTFAYRKHKTVWKDASPLTAEEILELDAFCRARYVELVPNQNSFGHMHRWLRHAEYRELAEFPEGFPEPEKYWWAPGPFGLNATSERSVEFLAGLYDELLPNFSSGQFNVGLDETIDLGLGASAEEVKARGAGAVYLEFLKKIHALVTARGKRMMFWGDIIIHYPELIGELPRDVIALEWGYDAAHPFDEHGAAFASAGIPFYVCPGTSAWISILGRTENMLQNIRNATENGFKYGAVGVLNTDWGDWGHWQFLPVSYPGLAYGAAMSWGVEANRDLDLARALDLFAFRDKAGVMGKAVLELGNVYRELGPEYPNASGLGRLMFKPLEWIRSVGGQTAEGFRRAEKAIERAARPMARARMDRPDARLIQREYAFAVRLAKHAARRGRVAFETSTRRAARMERELREERRGLVRGYKLLWRARNREGGLEESVGRMRAEG